MKTLKELTTMLTEAGVDESVLEGIPGLIDGIVEGRLESETSSLTLSKEQALREADKLKKKLDRFVDLDGKPIMVADLPALLELAEKGKKGGDDDGEDYETIKARVEEPWKAKEKEWQASEAELTGDLQQILVDERLKSELSKHGVSGFQLEAAVAVFKSQKDLVVDKLKGKRQAFEKLDGDQHVPISDSVKSFSESEKFKLFLPPNGSTGGGATGSDSSGKSSKETRFRTEMKKDGKDRNLANISSLKNEDRELYNRLAPEYGHPVVSA